ncbi:hypothetical protein FGO68_gene5041 [Halteria grandinella]|uniref:Uncharacterized protein n=1 Tax=Halteria grandinella TaxID=5974 RepID=A0A8J8P5F9_HALGN|nr:hypothetical protein FGO68_gene5041 [Halteria grandinella]
MGKDSSKIPQMSQSNMKQPSLLISTPPSKQRLTYAWYDQEPFPHRRISVRGIRIRKLSSLQGRTCTSM